MRTFDPPPRAERGARCADGRGGSRSTTVRGRGAAPPLRGAAARQLGERRATPSVRRAVARSARAHPSSHSGSTWWCPRRRRRSPRRAAGGGASTSSARVGSVDTHGVGVGPSHSSGGGANPPSLLSGRTGPSPWSRRLVQLVLPRRRAAPPPRVSKSSSSLRVGRSDKSAGGGSAQGSAYFGGTDSAVADGGRGSGRHRAARRMWRSTAGANELPGACSPKTTTSPSTPRRRPTAVFPPRLGHHPLRALDRPGCLTISARAMRSATHSSSTQTTRPMAAIRDGRECRARRGGGG